MDANEKKTKDSKKTIKPFWLKSWKKARPKNFCVDKGTEIAWEIEKFCAAERLGFHSVIKETKAAFAELQKNLDIHFYRHMKSNGYKYLNQQPYFVRTLNTRRNCSID